MKIFVIIGILLAVSANANVDSANQKTEHFIDNECTKAIFAMSDAILYGRMCMFYDDNSLGLESILFNIKTVNKTTEQAKAVCPATLSGAEYDLIEQHSPNWHLHQVNPTQITEYPKAIEFCKTYKTNH
ncbi:hypothetical protein LP123_04955 [Moraxella bovis]|uniref:Uncharacterized protein n=3 Tax=Moraxella bovis TaxID=476 RepID=A0AAQ2T0M7_MORBO|nr:hypothetical protein [Moraxella bovis]AWY19918.1 hypothetical protein DQF64_05035 [Moraxella bovis]UYZ74961.1 hypothetical protein LP093_09285 [Moraxella bovis]UYZ79108.1 hypothetical protein LP115_04565 [Moraxella bovis]UYZ80305.1 hypothetical protein LP113_09650 [Moraxella bovis]UYZ87590.1 hypothetical protein LP094_04580 [Moraxella bovis]